MKEKQHFLYSETYYARDLARNCFSDRELGVSRYRDAYLLPTRSGLADEGGVLDADGNYLAATGLHRGLGGKYPFSAREVSRSAETVIYIGMLCPIWGHCVTDHLRRLWFFFTEEYKKKYAGCRVVYLPMKNFSFTGSFAELLSILGIPYETFQPVTRITQFREVILPDECFFVTKEGYRFFTKEYRAMVDRIRTYAREHAVPTGCDRLYFTYRHYKRGKQVGEEKLEAFFREKGYRVLAPEKYSFKEQLNYLWNCRAFASTIGSSAHNVIFLKEGTRVTLIPRAFYLTEYQLALNQVWKLKVSFVDASASVFVDRRSPWTGPWYFLVTPELLLRFKDGRKTGRAFWHRQLRDFKKYQRLGLRNAEGKDMAASEFYLRKSWTYIAKLYRPGALLTMAKDLKRKLPM